MNDPELRNITPTSDAPTDTWGGSTPAGTPPPTLPTRAKTPGKPPPLKPDDQLVIRLLDLEQKTLAEISALTGWNQTLIKVRAFRARRKLQKLFQELQHQEKS